MMCILVNIYIVTEVYDQKSGCRGKGLFGLYWYISLSSPDRPYLCSPPRPLGGQLQSALPGKMTAYEFMYIHSLAENYLQYVLQAPAFESVPSKTSRVLQSRFLHSEGSWKEAEAILGWLSRGIHRYCQNNIQPSDGKRIWRWHH